MSALADRELAQQPSSGSMTIEELPGHLLTDFCPGLRLMLLAGTREQFTTQQYD